MTEKLYDEDSYIKKFYANVICCDRTEDGYICVLDKSAFFPEGGGQYADTGRIGDACVRDVQIKNGIIYHYIDREVEIDSVKECIIDWDKRYLRMQNHSGEHIISGIIHNKFGYDNVGFHLSDEEMTIDVNGKLGSEDIYEIERTANSILNLNIKIKSFYPSEDELSKIEYRSKLDLNDSVRIVQIGDIDCCACCAPHVNRTSEIGIIKIIRFYNYKGGVRIHAKCADLAREDYYKISGEVQSVSNSLSVGRYELTEALGRIINENHFLKQQLLALKAQKAESMAKSSKPENGICIFFTSDFDMPELIKLSDVSSKLNKCPCAAFSGNDKDGYNFVICGNGSKEFFDNLKRSLNVRGGGRDSYQGIICASENEIRNTLA